MANITIDPEVLQRHKSLCISLRSLLQQVEAEKADGKPITLPYVAGWLNVDIPYLENIFNTPTKEGFRLPYADQ